MMSLVTFACNRNQKLKQQVISVNSFTDIERKYTSFLAFIIWNFSILLQIYPPFRSFYLHGFQVNDKTKLVTDYDVSVKGLFTNPLKHV